MFDFGNANTEQKQAISAVEGPVLITAGPGTGKTYTLVQRAIYLIQEKGVAPEEILMATFTEKAAKELTTRITNELIDRNINANLNEMYVGTFHSICLRLIKENLEFTRMKKNYRTLDDFDQSYTVFQSMHKFKNIADVDLVLSEKGDWKRAGEICSLVNSLSEELIDFNVLKSDTDPQIAVLGEILEAYLSLLDEKNYMDFSSIQTEAYYLLQNNPDILAAIQSKVKYVMIDEYQDTNYIQEQIVFLLGGKSKNICVVGDDDQGLYRFRGATIRNILEFPDKFAEGECVIIPLVVNYRSNSDIVDFYNNWMSITDGARFRFRWDKYRYDKTIVPNEKTTLHSPAVVKLSSEDDAGEWNEKTLNFIKVLKDSGKLTDYNQIAFLFNSVKNEKVVSLARYLEDNGINVYSPRSDMFFVRDEIRLLLGCLMLMFPIYVQDLEARKFKFVDEPLCRYYEDCIRYANTIIVKDEYKELLHFVKRRGKVHYALKDNTDYGFSGLVYQMFEFEPFKSYLDVEMNLGVIDIRPTRNIALFSQIVSKYEYLHGIYVLNAKYMERDTEKLFNLYLRLLQQGGIAEYEDDAEYAPSGCVSFLTIHQSKGMEFPIVVVGSLGNGPRQRNNDLLMQVEEKYYKRPAYEPYNEIKYFDFWRLYYTAFSRAQNLLVLSANETKREPSMYFTEVYDELTTVDDAIFDISEFDFKDVKDVNLKDTYSFTSHIAVYETCSLQYKFFNELEFMPVRVSATLFGMLIHQTIEDIHRTAIRKDEYLITADNISLWLSTNYASLSQSERTYLAQPALDAALRQVLRYAEKQKGLWSTVQEAEVEVGLVKPDYIIEGKIDLIKGEGNTVELVDFKSEKKPDIIKRKDRLEHYKRQLQVYAHLVEEKTGHQVSKMHLYYTGEESGIPTITFPRDKESIDATIKGFDEIVHKIMRKEYGQKAAASSNACENCDFRYYCKR